MLDRYTQKATARRAGVIVARVAAIVAALLYSDGARAGEATSKPHASHASHAQADQSFDAGEPGSPQKAFRTIQISMREGDAKMFFVPDRIEVAPGEQVKFVIKNDGELDHEFVLGSRKEIVEHAAEMTRQMPGMEHGADPNARTVKSGETAELLWKFTKTPGPLEFACLIPGHYEAGMHGAVVVVADKSRKTAR